MTKRLHLVNKNKIMADKNYSVISLGDWIKIFSFFLLEWLEGLEEILFAFQWYRKRKGGEWELLSYENRISWSPVSCFVADMSSFGEIVDVLSTENWN